MRTNIDIDDGLDQKTMKAAGLRNVRKRIDCLIAAFRLMGGHSLLHDERDFTFEQILGLRVIHLWLQ